MYFSRLILNPHSRWVQRELANPYELHRTLLRAFPENSFHRERDDHECAGVLYRLDMLSPHNDFVLLVQSQMVPDWSFLLDHGPADYLLRTDPFGEENPAVKARTLAFRPGQMLNFRLRANPTKRLGKTAQTNSGKRVGLYTADQQTTWLQRKADQHGFLLRRVQISQDERIKREQTIPVRVQPNSDAASISTEQAKKRQKLELFSVQFDGILQVTDPDRFLTAIQAGIGSGKAFGFGLLSVAPVG